MPQEPNLATLEYLADQVGITKIRAQMSPEEKLDIVRQETSKAKTLNVGDGINDAPAMMAATVGMAIGQNSDVTAEAAGVVVMESSLKKVDEFMHQPAKNSQLTSGKVHVISRTEHVQTARPAL